MALAGRAFSATLLVLLALAASLLPATAQRPNGAGVVIQFEDGSRVFAYARFNEESLTSEQLLERTGLDVVMSPFGGMGAAVCSIQGEGCPASNCWCRSYGNPSYFWHFYAWDGARWVEQLQGASGRTVEDGDIDGWLWTSGETSLPMVTIEEIAALNGVELSEGTSESDEKQSTAPPGETSVAVLLPVDGTPVTIEVEGDADGRSSLTYGLFAVMLATVLAALAVVVIRGRAGRGSGEAVPDA